MVGDSDNISYTTTSSRVLYVNSSSLLFLIISKKALLSCHFLRPISYEGFDARIFVSFSTVQINTKNKIIFSAVILLFFSTPLTCKETPVLFASFLEDTPFIIFLKFLLLFIVIYHYLSSVSCSSIFSPFLPSYSYVYNF